MSTNLKVAVVDDLRNTPNIQKIEEAYEKFGQRVQRIIIKNREHLGSQFVAGMSCDHRWTPVDEAGTRAILQIHEEDHAEEVRYCKTCGASSLREGGRIFSYDATVPYPIKPRAKVVRADNGKR